MFSSESSNLKLPPLSLYVHIPWCVRKCPYCDFNSHTTQTIPETAYYDQLIRDLDADLRFVQGRELTSIFIGGGTPSLMSPDFYQRLLKAIASRVVWSDDIEITMEANPGTTEAHRFEGYRQSGINRLSIGVQSFNARHLKALGRIHSVDEASRAVKQAQASGFDNINVDLMHGLPDQSLEEALHDLKMACDLGTSHLSWYQLTIEQNTEFYSSPPILPADETLWDIQEQGQSLLQAAGFGQYEVSAYARDNRQARHNLNYWTFGDYIGIGAGAHAKVTFMPDRAIYRYRKSRTPKHYLSPKPFMRVGEERIDERDLPFEFMMNILRLNAGVDREIFSVRTGLPFDAIEPEINALVAEGLLASDQALIQATPKGHLFLNSVLERFITE